VSVALWSSDAWWTAVVGWIDRRLAELGRERRGAVTQPHLRPWATVLRVPTDDGPLWFKAGSPGTAFEASLYETLARVTPERILLPVAVDAARGWVLLPDGGPPLAETATGKARLEGLAAALVRYGELQRELAPHAGELLAAGVADMRPAAMPERFEEALEATRPDGPPEAIELWERIAERRGTVLDWCARLAESPLPASLDHNDLHPWNVLGGERFYDWGDSVVAHPFAVALVPLSFFDDPASARDAYLRGFGDPEELAPTVELACRVAQVARALIWDRALRASREQGEAIDARFEHAALETLGGVLD
jgi:hypothetical protein